MCTRVGAITDCVTIDIEVATKLYTVLKLFCGEHLAAVILVVVIPGQRLRHIVIHAEIEVGHQDDWRLQALCQIKGQGTKIKTLLGR